MAYYQSAAFGLSAPPGMGNRHKGPCDITGVSVMLSYVTPGGNEACQSALCLTLLGWEGLKVLCLLVGGSMHG